MHRRERLDQHVDLAAAAQPNGPGQVVTDAVVKQAGRLALEDRLRLLEDFPLETAAADGTGDLARLADRHPGAGRPRGAPPRADDGGDGHRVASLQPRLDVGHDVAHEPSVVRFHFLSPAYTRAGRLAAVRPMP